MNPSDLTFRGYLAEVQGAAEVAIQARREDPVEYDTWDGAVRYAISNDPRFTDYGHMLVTVLLSSTDPDDPKYGPPWTAFVDLDDDDPQWPEVVSQMARVCYYSDVTEAVFRELEEADGGEDRCPECGDPHPRDSVLCSGCSPEVSR